MKEDADKQIISSITNAPTSDQEKIAKLMTVEKLEPNTKEFILEPTNSLVKDKLTDEQVKNVFEDLISDPELAKMFMESNPGLADKAKCIQNPEECESDKIYDQDGNEVKLSATIEKAQLSKLMTLETKANESVKKGMENIKIDIDNNATVDGKSAGTYLELMKLGNGKEIFDKSLSEEEAAKRSIELLSEQAADLDSVKDDVGENEALLAQLEALKANMGNHIQGLMNAVVNKEVMAVVNKY